MVTPTPLNIEYTAAIKAVSSKHTEQDAQGLKADVNSLLKRDQSLRANLIREENKALTQRKKGPRQNGINSREGDSYGSTR